MKKENNLTFKALAGTLLALLIAVGSFVVVDASFPVRHWGPRAEAVELMENVFLLHTLLSSVMLLLSVYLVFTYLKDYLQLRSTFTLGLLIAVFSFMLFAIAVNPLMGAFLGVYGSRSLFTLIPNVFATIALAVLVWLSSK